LLQIFLPLAKSELILLGSYLDIKPYRVRLIT